MTLDRYGEEADSRKCRDPRCGNGCPSRSPWRLRTA